MPAYRIRQATLKDLDHLVTQRRGMWIDFGVKDQRFLDPADRVYRAWARARLRTGRLVGFLAETRSGMVVAGGCLWLQEVQPRPGFEGGGQPYLLSFYTHPDHRRQGLAERIVKACMAWSRKNRYPRVSLHASLAGRRIYKRLGFHRSWEMQYDLRPTGGLLAKRKLGTRRATRTRS